MRLLLVEPLGHREGHHSFESRRASHALVDAGAEITLVTFMGVHGDWAERERRVKHFSVLPARRPLLRLNQFLSRFPTLRSILTFLETFLTVALAMWRNRRKQYDVVHFFDSEPAFFFSLALASLLKNHNLVCTVYNPPPPPENWLENLASFFKSRRWGILLHTLMYELGESKLGAALRRLLYSRALRNNNVLFVCHTEEVMQSYGTYMRGIFQDKFVCIPLGVETSDQEVSQEYARQLLGLPSQRRVFLSFGNNHPGKDLEVIFRAFSALPKDVIILQAGKLGTGPESLDPQRLARKYGCAHNTTVKDMLVPDEEKILYFLAADAVILSYRHNFIQSASVINDAAKFSTPVIASDVGQLGEFVRSYGLGIAFTPEDPDSLRAAILRFLGLSEEEREAMKGHFARFRAAYSWTDNARKHVEVYGRLMSRARRGGHPVGVG